jgi:hypothetical protein
MGSKAYILIRTAPGLTRVICNTLRASPLIQSVEMITGPYDLIVAIEGVSTQEILTTVMSEIRPAAGVRDTLTCLVIPITEEGERSTEGQPETLPTELSEQEKRAGEFGGRAGARRSNVGTTQASPASEED